jgi:uncharacterized phage protein (TIGR02218 family)
MRTASAALISYLASNLEFLMADLYTITLINGTVLRYTNSDVNLTVGGNVYSKFLLNRTQTKLMVGMTVDTLSVDASAMATDTINGVPWLTAVRRGALDGADIKLEKLFMPTIGDTSLGTIILFRGRIADVTVGRSSATLSSKSELDLLNIQLPRNFYQSGCLHTLYDQGCTASRAAFTVSGSVTSTSSVSNINSSLGQASGWFDLGSLTFTSGVNNGITSAVKAFGGGIFIVALPLLTAPSVGDTFTAVPGCDKTNTTCQNKFSNLPNFRGYPLIPVPETAT